MFIRAAICAVVPLVLVGAATAPAMLPEMTSRVPGISSETVPLIFCAGPDGAGSGTGFRVGPDIVVTAGHVASIGACMIDGEIAKLIRLDKANDFAMFRTRPHNAWLHISCETMSFGESYHALGYAKGGPLYEEEVFGTIIDPVLRSIQPGFGETGMMVGREQFIPGMSGGPIFRNGRPVGIVIGYNKSVKVSYGRFLTDTELCRKS